MSIGIRAQLLSRLGNLAISCISGPLDFVTYSWLSRRLRKGRLDGASSIGISPGTVGRLISGVFIASRRNGDGGRLSRYDLIAVVDVGRIGIDVAS